MTLSAEYPNYLEKNTAEKPGTKFMSSLVNEEHKRIAERFGIPVALTYYLESIGIETSLNRDLANLCYGEKNLLLVAVDHSSGMGQYSLLAALGEIQKDFLSHFPELSSDANKIIDKNLRCMFWRIGSNSLFYGMTKPNFGERGIILPLEPSDFTLENGFLKMATSSPLGIFYATLERRGLPQTQSERDQINRYSIYKLGTDLAAKKTIGVYFPCTKYNSKWEKGILWALRYYYLASNYNPEGLLIVPCSARFCSLGEFLARNTAISRYLQRASYGIRLGHPLTFQEALEQNFELIGANEWEFNQETRNDLLFEFRNNCLKSLNK